MVWVCGSRGRVSIYSTLHIAVSVWSFILGLADVYRYFTTGIIPYQNDRRGQDSPGFSHHLLIQT